MKLYFDNNFGDKSPLSHTLALFLIPHLPIVTFLFHTNTITNIHVESETEMASLLPLTVTLACSLVQPEVWWAFLITSTSTFVFIEVPSISTLFLLANTITDIHVKFKAMSTPFLSFTFTFTCSLVQP